MGELSRNEVMKRIREHQEGQIFLDILDSLYGKGGDDPPPRGHRSGWVNGQSPERQSEREVPNVAEIERLNRDTVFERYDIQYIIDRHAVIRR